MQKTVETEPKSHFNKKTHKEFAVFGMYMNRKNINNAIKILTENGHPLSDITVLTPEKSGNRDFVYHQATNVKTGVVIGAAVGFILLGLVGIVVGANNRIDTGISSWIMNSSLAALGGLLFGAAAGALAGIGIPKPAARRYKFYLKEGGMVLMMHLRPEDDQTEAWKLLESTGGQDISILEESQIWTAVTADQASPTLH